MSVRSVRGFLLSCLWAAALAVTPAALAQGTKAPVVKKPPVPRKPVASAPTVKPPAPAPRLTAANLGANLLALGYTATVKEGAHRILVEEDAYAYRLDVKLTPSGDWLVCTAHLAPLADLTKVPAAPLLSLLGANDQLLGMYFSYDRATAQIVLNAAVPVRGVEPAALKTILESLRTTVKKSQGLWDPTNW